MAQDVPLTGYPETSVITPSFNQGAFLERTIKSVLYQNYPNLQYMIIDGGSTDDSVSIIKTYESKLAYWVSEPDRGQADAINKGLRRATGEWVAWQNSDDIYYPGVFHQLAKTAGLHPEVDLIIGNLMLYRCHGPSIERSALRQAHVQLLGGRGNGFGQSGGLLAQIPA